MSWECGGGGGVSVGLKPSDDKPQREAMMVGESIVAVAS